MAIIVTSWLQNAVKLLGSPISGFRKKVQISIHFVRGFDDNIGMRFIKHKPRTPGGGLKSSPIIVWTTGIVAILGVLTALCKLLVAFQQVDLTYFGNLFNTLF